MSNHVTYRCPELASAIELLREDSDSPFADTYVLCAVLQTVDNRNCSSTTPDVVCERNNGKEQ